MINYELIPYGIMVHKKNVNRYKNLTTNYLNSLTFHDQLYSYYKDSIKAFSFKEEFEQLRTQDYKAALSLWAKNFNALDTFEYILNRDDIKPMHPKKFRLKYPELVFSCLPKEVNNKPDPVENAIFLEWYKEKIVQKYYKLNFTKLKEDYDKYFQQSNNPLEYLKTTLKEIENEIAWKYSNEANRDNNGTIALPSLKKWQVTIFNDYDLKGLEPDWHTVSIDSARAFLESKTLIECRNYLKERIVEVESGKVATGSTLEFKGRGSKTELAELIYALYKTKKVINKSTGNPATLKEIQEVLQYAFSTKISSIDDLLRTAVATYKRTGRDGDKEFFIYRLLEIIKEYKEEQ